MKQLLLLLICIHAHALEPKRQFNELKRLDFPRSLIVSQTLSAPVGSDIESVIYGNRQYGYFRAQTFEKSGKKVTLRLIPPGYKYPIVFYFKMKSTGAPLFKRVYQKIYDNPFPSFVRSAKPSVWGSFSSNFIAINWPLAGSLLNESVAVPALVNRLGELVWIFPFERRGILPNWDVIFRKISESEYGITTQRDISGFQIVDFTGKVIKDLDFSKTAPSFWVHHSFMFLPDTQEALFLAYECRQVDWVDETLPIFSGLRGLYNFFTLPRRSVLGSALYRANLYDGSIKKIWDSFRSLSPGRHRNLSLADRPWQADRFINVASVEQYRAIMSESPRPFDFSKLMCNSDWTHENSVSYRKNLGYLISVRNMNRLVLLNEDGTLVGTIGEGRDNVFSLPLGGTAFSMQHDASFLDDGRILLFDNNIPYQGYAGARTNNRLQILKLDSLNKKVTIDWEFRIPLPATIERGSAQRLKNGNLLAYMPVTYFSGDVLAEISYAEKKLVSVMRIPRKYPAIGVEARAVDAIGDETPVDMTAVTDEKPLGGSEATPWDWNGSLRESY